MESTCYAWADEGERVNPIVSTPTNTKDAYCQALMLVLGGEKSENKLRAWLSIWGTIHYDFYL